jgi:hypothetical protein
MPLAFSATLVGVVVAFVVLRVVAPAIPLRPFAHRLTGTQSIAVVLGTVGLVLHCTAMFDRSLIERLPGTGGYVAAVNAMGAGSIGLYLLPALLLVVGLRRQTRTAVSVVGVSLIAVAITMYDHGPLAVHLAAIFTSGTLLAATLALLVRLPRRTRGRGGMRSDA